MPAKSKSQQRLMGMVHAYQKGKLKKKPSKKIKELAERIDPEDAEDFAKTKHEDIEKSAAYRLGVLLYKQRRFL